MKIFYLPDLGEGLPDAEIREWLIKEGDQVNVDQPIVSMETAKAIVDVPSPYTGRVTRFYGKPGDIIKTGHPLVEYEYSEGEVQTPLEISEDTGTVVGAIEVGSRVIKEAPTGFAPQESRANIRVTPAVRSLAKSLNVDINSVIPTGPSGTITIQDVKNASTPKPALPPEFEELHSVRRAMAITMAQAHDQIVPVTIVDDADIHNFSPKEDVTLRLIQALVAACKAEPNLNAHFDGVNLGRRLFSEINLGIAVDTKKGLYVPVIKHTESLSKEQVREQINQFKEMAQKQEFSPDTLHGATITLSNFGVFVGRYASPIVVPPTVAIIGVGKVRDEVIALNGQPVVHRIMPISLTFDHRAVTGGEAARFLAAFIKDLSS